MVNMSVAPGALESVRTFLNSWAVPNDTRVAVDRLPDLVHDAGRWRVALPGLPVPGSGEAADLTELRNRLRGALGQERPVSLQPLIDGEWRIHLGCTADEPAVTLQPERRSTRRALLAIVVEAVYNGRWHRLRACPDCGWVFYDSSRNARRTWCSMTTGDGARGCGSIAKTRAYRARQQS
jgi:CGNR zinc finger